MSDLQRKQIVNPPGMGTSRNARKRRNKRLWLQEREVAEQVECVICGTLSDSVLLEDGVCWNCQLLDTGNKP